MLWMYQRVFLGKLTNPANAVMKDIGAREKLLLLPILLVMLWIGVYSAPFLRRMEPSLRLVQQRIENARSPEGGYRVQRLLSPALRRTSEMMTNDLLLLMPQIILVVGGIVLMLLEPFTAPGQKGRMGALPFWQPSLPLLP